MTRIFVLMFIFLGITNLIFAQIDYEFFIDIRFKTKQNPKMIFEIIKPVLDDDAIENNFKLEKIDVIPYDEPDNQNLLSVSLKIIFNEESDPWQYCGDLKKDIATELINQKIAFMRMDCRF